jgi:hypothetical protein
MEKTPFENRETCKDCRYSDTIQKGTLLICRFNPPVVAHAFLPTNPGEARVISNSLWPVMANTDWCGKIEPRLN